MIAAGSPRAFIPYGREHWRVNGEVGVAPAGSHQLGRPSSDVGSSRLMPSSSLRTDAGILDAIRDFNLSDKEIKEHEQLGGCTKVSKEDWILRECLCGEDIHSEEELYFQENVAVWSRGGDVNCRRILLSMTLEEPLEQALWCNFTLNTESSVLGCDFGEVKGANVVMIPSVCLVGSDRHQSLHIFVENGEEFIVPLPFQVLKVWPTKLGLLLERKVAAHQISQDPRNRREQDVLPTLFSLLHPLDDVTPVTRRSGGGKIVYVTSSNQRVVYTCDNPSIVVTFDLQLGFHTIWQVRRAKPEEGRNAILTFDNSFVAAAGSVDGFGPLTMLGTPVGLTSATAGVFSSRSHFTLSSHSPSQPSTVSSPFRGLWSRGNSPLIISSRQHSPSMTGISRSQSPLVSTSTSTHLHHALSPAPNSKTLGNMSRTPLSSNVSGSYDRSSTTVEPLLPDLCLDPIWIEPKSSFVREGTPSGKATKVFFTEDAVGQKFICFLVSHFYHLRCIKLEETNDRTQLIFGSVTIISARDAVPIQGSALIVILDLSGSLVVYTGTTKICKVHAPLAVNPLCPLASGFPHTAGGQCGPPSSSRRNSLVTSSRPPSALDSPFEEEMRLLSPVPAETSVGFMSSIQEGGSFMEDESMSSLCSGGIRALRDPVRNRITVVMADGQMHRITIPPLSTSRLVDDSLETLRLVLPRDLALQTFAKWYLFTRAPGSLETTALQDWASFAVFLLSSTGYDTEKLHAIRHLDPRSTPFLLQEAPAKKFKLSESGSLEDWTYLKNSSHGNPDRTSQKHCTVETMTDSGRHVDSEAPLFPHIPAILYALHLFYEELKLDVSCWMFLPHVARLLLILAKDLGVEPFVDHYWRDFPEICSVNNGDRCHLKEDTMSDLIYPPYLSSEVPCIHRWLEDCLRGREPAPFPHIVGVGKRTRFVVMLYSVLNGKHGSALSSACLKPIGSSVQRVLASNSEFKDISGSDFSNWEAMVIAMLRLELTSSDLESIPVGVALPLRCAIYKCRKNPPSDWPVDAYILIGRRDLAAQLNTHKVSVPQPPRSAHRKAPIVTETKKPSTVKNDEDDGMDDMDQEVLQLLYGRDLRIAEVRRLLRSSKPVRIAVVQRPEVGDHDFIEEQERHLYAVCIRTMSLPVGRGMFTLRTLVPVVTETLPIPKLCLTGRAPPRDSVVDLSHIDVPSNMGVWPLFHNGVAAGLRIAPGSSGIDSTWIVYNKPKVGADTSIEHAGFLMALGLNGHLANLDIMNVFDYVAKGHEATSVALLLGIAASKRGTKNVSATKLLSIHVEALLPPTSTELDIPHVVQVAAVLGIGLVYQGTAHRHIAEVLLAEIGRPPGPEMENSTDRESYSLAAGLALGLVTLGKGSNIAGLSDLGMADWLYHYMVGGPKRPTMGPMREKYRSSSYQIKEGDLINVDVTSPGATLALALMFFATNNRAIAGWMVAPDTQYLLDFVRPDFLLLRTMSKGLIMWDEILPNASWVEGHLPEIIATAMKRRVRSNSVDYETLSQAYCNIVAGACMAMGLRFAGSANQEAYTTLLKFSRTFMGLLNKLTQEQAGRSTVETCANAVLLSLAAVMSGTGDLEVLRMCRHLHLRVGSAHPHVHYGSHLAVHMAIGMLFLGGGRYTLNADPLGVAALVCALFPKFPMHSNDNRYHLQAFRHLYVLAAQPRLVVPRDINTGRACFTHLSVTFKDTKWYGGTSVILKAPCLLPDLSQLSEVRVSDPRYWSVVFSSTKNWTTLSNMLEKDGGNLFVNQKMGCLSYSEDPNGFRSLLAQAIVKRHSSTWAAKPEAIPALTSNATVHNLVSSFLRQGGSLLSPREELGRKLITRLVHECVSREKVEMFSTLFSLLQLGLSKSPSSREMWQIRLATAMNESKIRDVGTCVVDCEFMITLDSLLEDKYQKWSVDEPNALIRYVRGDRITEFPPTFAPFLVRFGIPASHTLLRLIDGPLSSLSLPVLYLKLRQKNIPPEAITRIYRHLGHNL